MKRLFFILFCLVLCLLCGSAFSQESGADSIDSASDTHVYDVNSAEGRWFFGGFLSTSIVTDRTDSSYFAETFGGSVNVGYGLTQNLTILLRLEQNGWTSEEYNGKLKSGVFNIGIGIDYQIFSPNVHMVGMLGPSILTFNTALDEAGETGIFMEFAPLNIHWPVREHWIIVLSPFSLHIDIPVTHEPVLEYLQYRTTFGFYYSL